jgi:hypothetical protein
VALEAISRHQTYSGSRVWLELKSPSNGQVEIGRRLENQGASFPATWELFDDQAAGFENRAGLPPVFCEQIARSVLQVGEVRPGDFVVEIGPGTGQIGSWLSGSVNYIGLDLSAGMLGEFKKRLAARDVRAAMLVRADAGRSWPLADATVRLIFSSRALHLLPVSHIVSEVFRTAGPNGATLVIGRVERDRTSVRARMAREMMQRLRHRGFEAHQGDRQTQNLGEACRLRGAQVLEPVAVARWLVSTAPRQSIDSWRLLKGLGGVPVPQPIREQIFNELEVWAEQNLGGVDTRVESNETYVLRPLRIPAPPGN